MSAGTGVEAVGSGGSPAPESAFSMVSLIERKKRGGELAAQELDWLCREYVAGRIPDYQVAAWLMAVYWRGMGASETLALTRAMVATGTTLDWSGLSRPALDKHSTGGVGDKTSLVLVPLLAAAGLPFVKLSGRGLSYTGGTLDKLESIPGFRVDLSPAEMRAQVERIGCALVGQGPELVPADRLLYALRDVTATVDCLPLIAASIMSKKLAAGAGVMVLDVKYGAGAFMPDVDQARALARAMVAIGRGAGRRVRAVLSPMDEPLGRAVGNAPEVREAIETLHGRGPSDLWELTLELGTHLLLLSGAEPTSEAAGARLTALRDSGAGADRFARLIDAQGGDPRVVEEPARLPVAARVVAVTSPLETAAWVRGVDARTVGEVAVELGAGRRTKTDTVDPRVGVVLFKKTGEPVGRGEPIAELHASTEESAERAARLLRRAYRFAREPVAAPVVPFEVIGE